MNLAPIILFVYNRPHHTKRTIEALKKNVLANESHLIIYSDAAKREINKNEVKEVRILIKNIQGFKSVTIIEREKNFGLAKSIIEGVTETVNKFSKAIVLEDDLETSPYFLKYMNDGLTLYENDHQVASIHGYIYPIKNLDSSFFIKGADCWGWATWKRAWELFEQDGKVLYDNLIENNLTSEFDFNNSYPYSKMLKEQIEGKNSSWAVRWYASMFLKQMLTLYPANSFVKNIGNDNSGSHSVADSSYDPFLIKEYEGLKKIEIKENEQCKKRMSHYFRNKKSTVIGRIKLLFENYLK